MLYTFCTLSAILWLCYRLYKFLGIPVSKIVLTLRIRTPPATKVSIDRVSVDSISIHWENEPVSLGSSASSSSSISHYLLYVNNLQVAIFPNSPNSLYTCCSITGLKPETEHQLDFIAVNRMGFMNKLPSIYCMTKSKNTRQTVKKSGQWRKNTLTTLSKADSSSSSSSNMQVPESNQSTLQPAYANLTTLKDLESFSIEDLKKILICAQEDLHDVLSQQSSLLQDFQESKLQWELELENLKTHWSHEIDLRKSLKSTIKSLENSKLLYDLKLEKLKKNIDQSKSKIAKMEKDMHSWSLEELQQLNGESFRKQYSHSMEKIESNIEDLTQRIRGMQEGITIQEEDNKRLNTLKKFSTSNASVDNSMLVSQAAPVAMTTSVSFDTSSVTQEVMPLQVLLKKINEHTIDKTGQLTPAGEEMLSKVNSNSQVVSLIREQLKLDQELENKWKVSRNRMVRRLETLESMFADISLSNRQLRASLMVQPYAQNKPDSRNSNSNSTSTVALNEQSPAFSSSSMTHLSVPNEVSVGGQPASPCSSNPHQLVLHNPSTYASEDPNNTFRAATVSPVTVPVNATASTTRAALNHPSLVHDPLLSPQISGSRCYADSALLISSQSPVQSFSWTTEPSHNELHSPVPIQEQSPQRQQQSELDHPFEYDNANHLISGLRDMIYDETDSPDSISGYSKGFTTDQLDNYWTNQSTKSTVKNDTKPNTPSLLSYGGGSLRPTSPFVAGVGFNEPVPLEHSDSLSSVNNNYLGTSLMSCTNDSARICASSPQSQNKFASPRFSFLWNSGHPISTEPSKDVTATSGKEDLDRNPDGVTST